MPMAGARPTIMKTQFILLLIFIPKNTRKLKGIAHIYTF